jgi:hypothetical protein
MVSATLNKVAPHDAVYQHLFLEKRQFEHVKRVRRFVMLDEAARLTSKTERTFKEECSCNRVSSKRYVGS